MRHPHGLRAAAEGGLVLPAIGSAYEGGFFAGAISHTANNVATHLLIVAPSASGYNGQAFIQWKTTNTTTAGTTSPFDGAANSANMNNANHPAAQYCEGLSIGGYTDWYMPARYEMDIAYENLKPASHANDTSWGINIYSVPARMVNRTSGAPTTTSVAAFQSSGAEAFNFSRHWTSTEGSATSAWVLSPFDGSHFLGFAKNDGTSQPVRAFRKVAV